MKLHDRDSVAAFAAEAWQHDAFSHFASTLTQRAPAFPCYFGVAGFALNQLRYDFIEHDIGSRQAALHLAATLQTFLPRSKEFGKNTSLVVFFKETGDLGLAHYADRFWDLLSRLHEADARAWPKQIPQDTDNAHWEFSFGGEPVFVVCATPSHHARKSRHSRYLMLTFQPRWVFEGLIGPDSPRTTAIQTEIRERIAAYDTTPASGFLSTYGLQENREWKQYFLDDGRDSAPGACPFNHHLNQLNAQVIKTNVCDLNATVHELLPPTGAIEVQYDTPHRVHEEHRHDCHETLHVVEGSIDFIIQDSQLHCEPGDRLLLPARTPHKSIAGEQGCTYVIATRIVPPSPSIQLKGLVSA